MTTEHQTAETRADPLEAERRLDRPSQAGRGTSYWHHFSCRECPWSRSVQINAKPGTIRKGFRLIGEHAAAHRENNTGAPEVKP